MSAVLIGIVAQYGLQGVFFACFAAGVLLMLVILATTRTVTGRKYLYPLLPFNRAAFVRLLLRRPIDNQNS